MTWWQMTLLAGLAVVLVVLVWVGRQLMKLAGNPPRNDPKDPKAALAADARGQALEEVNHLFNDAFREELRNHGRLKFENIINENAMFLKQDLDMTIAQLNEYLKKEIDSKLNDEFAAYGKAMKDAQELAMNSLQKSITAVEEQRKALTEDIQKDIELRKANMLKNFEENMAKIIEYYLKAALGDQFDLKSQLPYIISQMETNKQAIIEDMRL